MDDVACPEWLQLFLRVHGLSSRDPVGPNAVTLRGERNGDEEWLREDARRRF